MLCITIESETGLLPTKVLPEATDMDIKLLIIRTAIESFVFNIVLSFRIKQCRPSGFGFISERFYHRNIGEEDNSYSGVRTGTGFSIRRNAVVVQLIRTEQN